jgi:hypothetical protein
VQDLFLRFAGDQSWRSASWLLSCHDRFGSGRRKSIVTVQLHMKKSHSMHIFSPRVVVLCALSLQCNPFILEKVVIHMRKDHVNRHRIFLAVFAAMSISCSPSNNEHVLNFNDTKDVLVL